MRKLFLGTFFLSFFIIFSCDRQDSTEVSFEEFVQKINIELTKLEETNGIPLEDIEIFVSKDSNDLLTAKYRLIGQSKEFVELGVSARLSCGGGRIGCSSAYSCGRLLKKCLDKGCDGVISSRGCDGDDYCVSCYDPNDYDED